MESDLLKKLKEHIRLEGDMDDSLLPSYISAAQRYVKKKTGDNQEYLVIMVTTVMFEHRLSSKDLKEALEALEPIFMLEVLTSGNNE